MISVKKLNLGKYYQVSWIPIEDGKRIYFSSSVKKEAEEERLPLKGRIDPIADGNWVLSISNKDEENYFFSCASHEIAAGISLAEPEKQLQDCGMLRTPRGDAIFYCKNKKLPIVCREMRFDLDYDKYEYFLYGEGVFMRISERSLDAILNCPDIVWTNQCNIKDRYSEKDCNFKIYWLPVRDEKRLYISNLFSSDLKDIPPVGVIRELKGGDYVVYPFEGKENYNFPYKYYQYWYMSAFLSSTQLPGEGYQTIKLGGKYGMLNRRLFISPHPLVLIVHELSKSTYILFKGETLDFSPEVFKIVSEHPSLLDECSDKMLYTIIKRPDILLPLEGEEKDIVK
jgi:hypothetical protein